MAHWAERSKKIFKNDIHEISISQDSYDPPESGNMHHTSGKIRKSEKRSLKVWKIRLKWAVLSQSNPFKGQNAYSYELKQFFLQDFRRKIEKKYKKMLKKSLRTYFGNFFSEIFFGKTFY